MTAAPLIIFAVLAAVAVASGLAMMLSQNAVYSALFLVINFTVVAVLFLILGAPFIAMLQITVYAGAIMVLFIFVIMLLGGERLPAPQQRLRWQQPLAVVLVLALLALAGYVFAQGAAPAAVLAEPQDYGSPAALGLLLFTKYLFPFEFTSLLLLVAMIGVVVLTAVEERRRRLPRASRRT
ncbi:MAG: NADH-quinone oxidoreductase chain [Chloroflexota bacterium]|jgi:NADH-quinone oxidoreductase subunit J|nr:MAG: NADH-quinone oxidoreductase subunit J [Chloroflexota bacterium]RLT54659.1 MAG: NADH-quinone oxidoreductase subunit J [Chloroflexota bacterium]